MGIAVCRFHGSAGHYSYILPPEISLSPGDLAIVPARDFYAIVHVVKVDLEDDALEEVQNSPYALKEVIAKFTPPVVASEEVED